MKNNNDRREPGPGADNTRPAAPGPGPKAGLVPVQRGGLPVLIFPHLAVHDDLQHAVTTREGGVSRPPHHSLNLSRSGDDSPAAVTENRRRLQNALASGRLVFSRQVHGTTVAALKQSIAADDDLPVGTADAMVTDCPGRLLTILVADCQAVMMFDPQRRVVANIHSGWRGSIANVIGATVAVMQQDFGCRPGDIWAAVGPSLGPCCAEFKNYRDEIPPAMWSYRVSTYHFNFWALSRDQLTAAGLAPDRIRLGRICTRCHPERFFSYRAGHKTGRFAAVIGMRPK